MYSRRGFEGGGEAYPPAPSGSRRRRCHRPEGGPHAHFSPVGLSRQIPQFSPPLLRHLAWCRETRWAGFLAIPVFLKIRGYVLLQQFETSSYKLCVAVSVKSVKKSVTILRCLSTFNLRFSLLTFSLNVSINSYIN